MYTKKDFFQTKIAYYNYLKGSSFKLEGLLFLGKALTLKHHLKDCINSELVFCLVN